MKNIVKLFSTSTINNAGYETGNTTLWECSNSLTADPSLQAHYTFTVDQDSGK